MRSEQQYIDLYRQSADLIKAYSTDVMNSLRDEAFGDFQRLGFPTRRWRDINILTYRRYSNLTTD